MNDRLRQRLGTDIVSFSEVYGHTEVVHAPLVLAPIHRAMLDVVDFSWQRGLVPVAIMPFGHGKSMLALQVVLWTLVSDTRLRLRYISASKAMAARATSYVRSTFESIPFRRDFGIEAARPWTPETIVLKRNAESRDPTLVASGVLSVTSGVRGDLFVFDDLESDVDSGGETDATKVRAAYKRLQTRLSDPWCRSLVVCTRQGVGDLVGEILANDVQRHAHAIVVFSMETRGPQRGACLHRRVILPDHDFVHQSFGWGLDSPAPAPDLPEDDAALPPPMPAPRLAKTSRRRPVVRHRQAPPPPADDPGDVVRREHEQHIRFEATRGISATDRWGNACPHCHAAGYHRKFHQLERRHFVQDCAACQTAFAQETAA